MSEDEKRPSRCVYLEELANAHGGQILIDQESLEQVSSILLLLRAAKYADTELFTSVILT